MKKIFRTISSLILLIAILQPNINIIAQDLEDEDWDIIEESSLNKNGVKSGELANCSDLDNSQNIRIELASDKALYKPNDIVEIIASITNKNPYPIIDAEVRAKIFKSHPNLAEDRSKYITIDEIVLKDNLILKPNENLNLTYNYSIPVDATGGEYIIQYYIYNQDRFNLAGLSFTEDIVANMTSFVIEGKASDVYLDKTNITVDGKPHNTRGFMTQNEGNKNIPIKIPLVNSTDKSKEMEVSYRLYKWDEILESNFIKEENRLVTVNANSRVDLEYNLEAQDEPVYYLVITAKNTEELNGFVANSQTMAHIRLAIEGKNKPRINWVGLNKYPFQKGDEVQLMVCAHNTSYDTDQGPVRVLSTVRDARGKLLTKVDYEGEMVASISGISNKFKADKSLNVVNIETNLYNAKSELIDSIKTTYNCKDINPELCVEEKGIMSNIYILTIVLGFIFITIISVILVKKYKNVKK